MNLIKHNLKIFLLFSQYSLKTTLQGRLGVLFFVLGKVLRFFFFIFLIFLIFGRTKIIKGYDFNQVIIFYLTFNIIDTASQTLFREVYRFRQLVLSGNFDLVLIRPHHPFLKILIGGVDFLDVFMLIIYVILTFFFILKIPNFHLLSSIFYLLLLLNSLLIATAFHIAVLAFGILTTEVDHTIMIYRDLIALGRFPIDIYKEPVREIFTFIIPIAIMMSFPPKALFGLLSWQLAVFSFLLSLILLFLSLKFWGYALKKYQSWGG